jgi:hypothetical protein
VVLCDELGPGTVVTAGHGSWCCRWTYDWRMDTYICMRGWEAVYNTNGPNHRFRHHHQHRQTCIPLLIHTRFGWGDERGVRLLAHCSTPSLPAWLLCRLLPAELPLHSRIELRRVEGVAEACARQLAYSSHPARPLTMVPRSHGLLLQQFILLPTFEQTTLRLSRPSSDAVGFGSTTRPGFGVLPSAPVPL